MPRQELNHSEPEGELFPCRLLRPVFDLAGRLRGGFADKLKGALHTFENLRGPSQTDRFIESGIRNRVTLMEQLSPVAETLEREGKAEYNFETPDSPDLLDQTERKTLVKEVLYRAMGKIHGILDGSASIERLKINIISVGAEYDYGKSARVTFEIFIEDGSPCASDNQHIINVSN